jgi:hypothetical protein
MNILVDENIPLMSVDQLRQMGHDVLDIRGTSDEGVSDELLWNRTCQEKRLLITTDRGFAHYRNRDPDCSSAPITRYAFAARLTCGDVEAELPISWRIAK